MLNLSNDDRKQLRAAIESAYPEPNDLKRFVDEELNKNLATISTAPSHSAVVFDLIKWAIAKGYIDDLILALAKDTQNPDIQRFCVRVLRQHLSLNGLNASDSLTAESLLDLEPTTWDLEVSYEELQSFLPKQFSFEADVGNLRRGLELANSVCKITFADRPPQESGTGVLIAPDLVLTNYHVLSLKEGADLNAIAKSARFEFGYVSPKFDETTRIQTLKAAENDPVPAFSTIDKLDYALLRISPDENCSIEPVPFNASLQLMPKSPLNMLQHPEGDAMKVSLSNNGVVKTNEAKGLVLYVNPTKRGSSGSPCFDHDWRLVALHHKEMATSFGSVREGILFSAIYPQILSVL
ncbi:trypsin-like peptidase domain-containing protein [Oscillatoria sp. FACHB-1407]|uniref:trypsin-like peptidase domain-containing protein n=1 Tax=Oscillatoria sp. FACHB-1407 TaxID=2692847 RepID=UPI00168A185A|nr:trypsin-like peptidase domain-containing protein [Oscillatoria sp. FACHB-1407]MBD2465770.1 trypsin-like peptidase domain-containing protein [Oscillatoria sp. FACHB-1407]